MPEPGGRLRSWLLHNMTFVKTAAKKTDYEKLLWLQTGVVRDGPHQYGHLLTGHSYSKVVRLQESSAADDSDLNIWAAAAAFAEV